MRTVIGPEWRELRECIITVRGRICEDCRRIMLPSEPLLLHHIDKDPSNNESRNLRLLCTGCHDKAHNWRKD